LAAIKKELKEAKANDAALGRYINAKRKKVEDQRKEEARTKEEEGQSSKDLIPPDS
jgi:hypothetical protein